MFVVLYVLDGIEVRKVDIGLLHVFECGNYAMVTCHDEFNHDKILRHFDLISNGARNHIDLQDEVEVLRSGSREIDVILKESYLLDRHLVL